ncbi:NADH dehydrogenase [ubiquinone] 1 alpha subcomplex subunit 1 [Penaeus vannamei]|uniref:NADH dehydrogenase [ubiquinone] 1 alpha subcomplex subunit 1 n=1 Tax=Penaeus vannamei TaxID=6689 RepID=UPI00387F3A40
MWYEIIPSLAAVTTFLGVPTLLIAGIHKVAYGNLYQRDLNEERQRFMFLRDERLTGSGFKHFGLENIPDEETSE